MEGTNSSEANPTTDLVSEEENDELVTAKKPETFSSAGKMFILPQGTAQYVLSKDNLYEIQQLELDPTYTSAFVDQTVISDGSLYMCTVCDVNFIIIDLLEKYASAAYRNLQEILSEAGGDYSLLRGLVEKNNKLSTFCDSHVVADNTFWKLNKEKLASFLKKRVLRISNQLKEMNYTPPSQVASFKRVNQTFTETDFILFAISFLSEYLSSSIIDSLHTTMGLTKQDESNHKTKTEDDVLQACFGRNSVSAQAKAEKKTEAKVDKIDKTGMRSLATFFAPKQKK